MKYEHFAMFWSQIEIVGLRRDKNFLRSASKFHAAVHLQVLKLTLGPYAESWIKR